MKENRHRQTGMRLIGAYSIRWTPTWARLTSNGGILVNAAFLLVTSAWFAGQTPAPAPAAPGPAVVSSAQGCGSGGCGGGCDSCCSGGHSWFGGGGRLGGLFHRNSCCDTCNTCDSCGSGHSWGSRFSGWGGWGHGCNSCNTCQTSCNTCDSGCGHGGGLFSGGRLRGLFHRNSCCDTCSTCDGGCGSTGMVGGAPVPTPAPTGGEQLTNPPKKMPSTTPAPAPAPAQKQVRINNTPGTTTPFVPNTPNIEVVPPPVPSLEAERRDPPF